MKRHPPRATRTYTRFPSTTHFLSKIVDDAWQIIILSECAQRRSQPHTVPAELYNLGVACGAGPEQELATVGEAREAADAPETARIRSALAASSERQKSPRSRSHRSARALIHTADRPCIMVDGTIYPPYAARHAEPAGS